MTALSAEHLPILGGEQPAAPPLRHELPAVMELYAWPDPVVERFGYGPLSQYVEVVWLPVLGPTATWLYRRLGSWAEAQPQGSSIDLTDLSLSLGLGEALGPKSTLARSLHRLERFNVAYRNGHHLAVRRALGTLPNRMAMRLNDSALAFHRQTVESFQTVPMPASTIGEPERPYD